MDLRQRRRAALADEIEQVAIDLFVRRGYGDVTVEEITTAVGISPRTFFRYFPTKADLIRTHRRRIDERLLRALAARPADEAPVTALRAAFASTSRMHTDHREQFVRIGRMVSLAPESGTSGMTVEMRHELVELVARRAGVDPTSTKWPELLVAVMSAASDAAFRTWLDLDGKTDLETMIATAFDAIGGGWEGMQQWRPPEPEGGSLRNDPG